MACASARGAAGSAAEGDEEVKDEEVKTGAEAETVVTPAKITKDAWKESNQYKTLQGSLNKMTKERDQLIKGRDDLQCKLAEQTDTGRNDAVLGQHHVQRSAYIKVLQIDRSALSRLALSIK